MKKIVAMLLALVIVIGLSACGAQTAVSAAASSSAASSAKAPESSASSADASSAVSSAAASSSAAGTAAVPGQDLTFVIIPKVVHAWCDEIHKGAEKQAAILSKQLGVKVTIDYRAPQHADLVEQNSVLEQAAATNPAGIAIDPVDFDGSSTIIKEIQGKGIPVVVFDSVAPDGSGITNVGNNYTEQGQIAAEMLAKRINQTGKVAVMKGYPAAENHTERYNAIVATLSKYPGITVIDGGIDNDSNEDSRTQAQAVLAANPDLVGYVNCDATGAGAAAAIEEAGKTGKVTFVCMDCLVEILDYMKKGVISASAATIPQMQGSMSVLVMWQAHCGAELPKFVDTGVAQIDETNVDYYMQQLKSN